MKKLITAGIIISVVGIWITVNFGISSYFIYESGNNLINTIEETPFGRDQYRAEMRAHSQTPEKIHHATKAIKTKFSKRKNQKDAGLSTWEELGPGNYAGRTRAIALHPTLSNEIWVGGVSGGLWKSTDSGNSWTSKGQDVPNFSITSIIIHPTQPDTMYVSTGEGITAFGARAVTEQNPYQSTRGSGIHLFHHRPEGQRVHLRTQIRR